MDKNKIQSLIFLVLIIAILSVLLYKNQNYFIKKRNIKLEKNATQDLSTKINYKPKSFAFEVNSLNPASLAIDFNPFKKLKSKLKAFIDATKSMNSIYKLSGIIFKEKGSIAIINDNIYKVGDKIDDFTIIKIYPKKVILKDYEKIYELNL